MRHNRWSPEPPFSDFLDLGSIVPAPPPPTTPFSCHPFLSFSKNENIIYRGKLPIHFSRKDAINKTIFNIEDSLGGSSRIVEAPIPLVYTRHTARFLAVWLLALPLGLYGQFGGSWNHCAMIPATAFISMCLLGIEELATQLEEPFTILPMQVFCDTVRSDCDEIVSWAVGGGGGGGGGGVVVVVAGIGRCHVEMEETAAAAAAVASDDDDAGGSGSALRDEIARR
jgi:hypothetical protein